MALCRQFWLQKLGNKPQEYEDAYAVGPDGTVAAVADGATTSSFAREWARLLVQSFRRRPQGWLCPPEFEAALEGGRQTWARMLQRRSDVRSWPRHAREKALRGAFATLLGVRIYRGVGDEGDAAGLLYRAIAVGDSCLLHVRDGRLLGSFPLTEAAQFTSGPRLLCSRAGLYREVEPKWAQATCEPGDRLWLATDAVARAIFAELEAGRGDVWERLSRLRTRQQWRRYLEQARADGLMRNDDSTLVLLQVPQEAEEAATAPLQEVPYADASCDGL